MSWTTEQAAAGEHLYYVDDDPLHQIEVDARVLRGMCMKLVDEGRRLLDRHKTAEQRLVDYAGDRHEPVVRRNAERAEHDLWSFEKNAWLPFVEHGRNLFRKIRKHAPGLLYHCEQLDRNSGKWSFHPPPPHDPDAYVNWDQLVEEMRIVEVEAIKIGQNRNGANGTASSPKSPHGDPTTDCGQDDEDDDTLTNEDRAIAILVNNPGVSIPELAERLGVTRQTPYKWKRFRSVRDHLQARSTHDVAMQGRSGEAAQHIIEKTGCRHCGDNVCPWRCRQCDSVVSDQCAECHMEHDHD